MQFRASAHTASNDASSKPTTHPLSLKHPFRYMHCFTLGKKWNNIVAVFVAGPPFLPSSRPTPSVPTIQNRDPISSSFHHTSSIVAISTLSPRRRCSSGTTLQYPPGLSAYLPGTCSNSDFTRSAS
jgi:hypothetical protein